MANHESSTPRPMHAPREPISRKMDVVGVADVHHSERVDSWPHQTQSLIDDAVCHGLRPVRCGHVAERRHTQAVSRGCYESKRGVTRTGMVALLSWHRCVPSQ